jgi:hypothetical protein
MKTRFSYTSRARSQRAMTLVEMMVNLGLFTIAVMALVTVNLFGLFSDELINSSLGASDQARVNFNQMLDEIRAGKNVQIGTGNYANFRPTTNGLQQGDTIQIQPTTNLSYYIYYYFVANAPTNSSWLMRAMTSNYVSGTTNVTNYILVSTNIMAQCLTNMNITNVGLVITNLVTNSMLFSAVAYNGTTFAILTNDPTVYSTHNYLVNVLLQFYQYQYPLTKVGTGSNYLYTYYQLELAAARRAE